MFAFSVALLAVGSLPALDESRPPTSATTKPSVTFEPFTGKITGSKVRLRLQPNLDGTILKELNRGDLLVITGEYDEYYAVKPESSYKGYVYRSYVIDNVVEANHVNLRLEPDTNAPILTQLGEGDTIQGTMCPENNKWLMIDLPETVCFYVAKEYVQRLGDAGLFRRIETRKTQVSHRLEELEHAVTRELQKSFSTIQLVPIVNELQTIIAQNEDQPALTSKAQALIKTAQTEYLTRSQSLAEAKQISSCPSPEESVATAQPEPQSHYASLALEQQEKGIVETAIQSGKVSSREMFYSGEVRIAEELLGQIVPYDRIVRGRPGDFMFVDAKTKVPVAYLYSCHIDLSSYVGQTVRIAVSSRPNHQFALPAYFVHELKRW